MAKILKLAFSPRICWNIRICWRAYLSIISCFYCIFSCVLLFNSPSISIYYNIVVMVVCRRIEMQDTDFGTDGFILRRWEVEVSLREQVQNACQIAVQVSRYHIHDWTIWIWMTEEVVFKYWDQWLIILRTPAVTCCSCQLNGPIPKREREKHRGEGSRAEHYELPNS